MGICGFALTRLVDESSQVDICPVDVKLQNSNVHRHEHIEFCNSYHSLIQSESHQIFQKLAKMKSHSWVPEVAKLTQLRKVGCEV